MLTGKSVLVLVGIAVCTGFLFLYQGAMVHAEEQLVGVTRATNLIGKQVKNVDENNLGEIKTWSSIGEAEDLLNMPSSRSEDFWA